MQSIMKVPSSTGKDATEGVNELTRHMYVSHETHAITSFVSVYFVGGRIHCC